MKWDWNHLLERLYAFNQLERSQDISLQLIEKALQSQTIQHRWIEAMTGKLQKINMELDKLLDKPDKDRIWEALAVERRTLLRCLTMILDVQDELDSERVAEEARTRLYEKYKGASAPISTQ